MTTIQLTQHIPAAPQAVYDYVTRPACWKEWHPASLGTPGHGQQPLSAGAMFEEDIRSAGFKRHLRWKVQDSRPAQRWQATAVMDDGSRVDLLYEFAADDSGTLGYELKPWLLRLLNDLLVWRKVRRESLKAMRNLAGKFSMKTP